VKRKESVRFWMMVFLQIEEVTCIYLLKWWHILLSPTPDSSNYPVDALNQMTLVFIDNKTDKIIHLKCEILMKFHFNICFCKFFVFCLILLPKFEQKQKRNKGMNDLELFYLIISHNYFNTSIPWILMFFKYNAGWRINNILIN
jgi:hypothetical protein